VLVGAYIIGQKGQKVNGIVPLKFPQTGSFGEDKSKIRVLTSHI